MFELFFSTFALVFFYGFQTQAVTGGLYRIAFCNSVVISSCNLVLFKLAPSAKGPLEIAGFVLGGPVAIVLSMFVFRKWFVTTPKEASRISALETEVQQLKALLEGKVPKNANS